MKPRCPGAGDLETPGRDWPLRTHGTVRTPPRGRMSTGLPGKWLAPLMDQERLRWGKAELDYESSEESQRAALLSHPDGQSPHKGYGPKGSPWNQMPCLVEGLHTFKCLVGLARVQRTLHTVTCAMWEGPWAQRSLNPRLLLLSKGDQWPQKAAGSWDSPRGPRAGRDSQEHPLACHWGRAEDAPAKTQEAWHPRPPVYTRAHGSRAGLTREPG